MTHTRLISAGYFLARRCPRPKWVHAEPKLLPDSIVTLSPCLTDIIPNLWPSQCVPGARPDTDCLARLGISTEGAARAEAWADARCAAHPDEWPLPFHTLDMLFEFDAHFLAANPDVQIVGAALPEDLSDAFLSECSRDGGAAERCHSIRRGLEPEAGGVIAGYEILGNGSSESHSIICTAGEKRLHEMFGIAMNNNGLVETLADARRGAVWASEDGHGEPVRYFPWRLTLYERAEKPGFVPSPDRKSHA